MSEHVTEIIGLDNGEVRHGTAVGKVTKSGKLNVKNNQKRKSETLYKDSSDITSTGNLRGKTIDIGGVGASGGSAASSSGTRGTGTQELNSSYETTDKSCKKRKESNPARTVVRTVGQRGGVNDGGVAVGENDGEIHVDNNPETERSTRYEGCKNITNTRDVEGDNISVGGGGGTSGAGKSSTQAGNKKASDIDSAELAEILTKRECSEDTIKKFRENKITGDIFFKDHEEIFQILDIQNGIDKLKLRRFVEDFKP